MAMELEKKGMAFYRRLVDQAHAAKTKEIFLYLFEQEERHLSYFSEMFESLDQPPTVIDTMDETTDYLGAIIENGVLGKVLQGIDLTNGDQSVSRALNIGMEVEKESALFYQGMEPMVPVGKRPILEKIIQEEKEHLIQLSKIKRELMS